jgi:hypothetical protein
MTELTDMQREVFDFVREKLSQGEIDEIWWEEAGRSRDALKDALSRRYKWIGEMAFVGRGPGWLAIEDTECSRLTGQLALKGKSRNWDTIGKVVDQYLKSFIKSMEDPRFWRDVANVAEVPSASHHSTRARPKPARHHSTRKSPAQLDREIAEAVGTGGAGTGSYPFSTIRPGCRVTIVTPQHQQRTGTAVMRGPHGWVLNLGGKHGTPGIATEANVIQVRCPSPKMKRRA